MKGQVLGYSGQKESGIIVTADEQRFVFTQAEWNEDTPPNRGVQVYFEVGADGQAQNIYLALPEGSTAAQADRLATVAFAQKPKRKPTMTLLALFLGTLGAHKFYVGAWGWGIVYVILSIFLLSIPLAIVETVRYILMSDEEFQAKVNTYQATNPGPFSFFW